ncbi:aldehyde reductase [Seiridium cupressi]
MDPVPLTWGCASVYTGGAYDTTATIEELFAVLHEVGITHLDSAQLYGDCEVLLGGANVAARHFTIDSKTPGGWVSGSLEPGKLKADFHTTLMNLGVTKLDTFYIHGPDPTAPIEPALQALDDLHREGYFDRLGLSNFTADEVAAVHQLCAKRGWLIPSVYQGSYSAFSRRQETELFPTLRKLGLSFSAYSPLAGGFLARRNANELTGTDSGGRFAVDPNDPEGKKGGVGLYRELYSSRPKLVQALSTWASIADRAGCSCPAEMAYRWVVWDSALDADRGDRVTIGASRISQLRKTAELKSKGSLGAEICAKIDALWKEIEDASPLDNLHK